MGRKQIDFKLPEDLLQAVQAKASEEQTSATEIVPQALTSYLSKATDILQTEELLKFQELEQDVANNTEFYGRLVAPSIYCRRF